MPKQSTHHREQRAGIVPQPSQPHSPRILSNDPHADFRFFKQVLSGEGTALPPPLLRSTNPILPMNQVLREIIYRISSSVIIRLSSANGSPELTVCELNDILKSTCETLVEEAQENEEGAEIPWIYSKRALFRSSEQIKLMAVALLLAEDKVLAWRTSLDDLQNEDREEEASTTHQERSATPSPPHLTPSGSPSSTEEQLSPLRGRIRGRATPDTPPGSPRFIIYATDFHP